MCIWPLYTYNVLTVSHSLLDYVPQSVVYDNYTFCLMNSNAVMVKLNLQRQTCHTLSKVIS